MSRRRKHVTQSVLQDEVEPPSEGQVILRALGSRGGNVLEAEYPDGSQTLVMIPQKFNKKVWVKRGGFVIVDEGEGGGAAPANAKVTGSVATVLYEKHIKALRKLPGVWPAAFDDAQREPRGEGDASDENDGDASDDSMPAEFRRNENRAVFEEHFVSDSSDDEE